MICVLRCENGLHQDQHAPLKSPLYESPRMCHSKKNVSLEFLRMFNGIEN